MDCVGVSRKNWPQINADKRGLGKKGNRKRGCGGASSHRRHSAQSPSVRGKAGTRGTASCGLLTAVCLLPSASFRLPPASCLLLPAHCSRSTSRGRLLEGDGVVIGFVYFVEQPFERFIGFGRKEEDVLATKEETPIVDKHRLVFCHSHLHCVATYISADWRRGISVIKRVPFRERDFYFVFFRPGEV